MGLAKSELFTNNQNEIAAFAKVFGHPARVSILQHLFKINRCICGDLVTVIGLAQPTISQHLRELKELQLIKGTIEGTSVCYCINHEKWKSMKNVLTNFLNMDVSNPLNCCETDKKQNQ